MSAPETVPDTSSQHASLGKLATIFGRYGNMTFGGGSATIAVLHQEIVSKRSWISEDDFGLCYALSRVTPGTNLLAFETGVGWIVRGWLGAIISLVAGSLPCSAMAVLVTFAYESFSQNVLVARAIRGALAATVGLMLVTSIQHPDFGKRNRLSVLASDWKQQEDVTFNPTVAVCQSGRTEQQADFDGLGSKENSPGMLGTSLSTLESSVLLKSCARECFPSPFQFLRHSTQLGLPSPDHRKTRVPGG